MKDLKVYRDGKEESWTIIAWETKSKCIIEGIKMCLPLGEFGFGN